MLSPSKLCNALNRAKTQKSIKKSRLARYIDAHIELQPPYHSPSPSPEPASYRTPVGRTIPPNPIENESRSKSALNSITYSDVIRKTRIEAHPHLIQTRFPKIETLGAEGSATNCDAHQHEFAGQQGKRCTGDDLSALSDN
ncbi:hypothetical protein N7494_005413 [Penicillium frequentans]|uniref:Uncharacterized protein n=1 Tax=Penicillium frequentans TaxID=3151616 RepID=A0AAD6CY50_9EURO|nr:hypothetical protein N7494_005396 [Penicillium glabrum]KAJ5544134.1 hypothetical protein N7494_005413 [Penicillium glabrum]